MGGWTVKTSTPPVPRHSSMSVPTARVIEHQTEQSPVRPREATETPKKAFIPKVPAFNVKALIFISPLTVPSAFMSAISSAAFSTHLKSILSSSSTGSFEGAPPITMCMSEPVWFTIVLRRFDVEAAVQAAADSFYLS